MLGVIRWTTPASDPELDCSPHRCTGANFPASLSGRPGLPVIMAGSIQPRIVSDPAIHHGEPCIRGTRISVAIIVGSLADVTIEELLAHDLQITREDVRAALQFAAAA